MLDRSVPVGPIHVQSIVYRGSHPDATPGQELADQMAQVVAKNADHHARHWQTG